MGGGASFAFHPIPGSARFRAESGIRPRSYRGTRPRFASGTLMSLRTIPPFRVGSGRASSGCGRVFRMRPHGVSPDALSPMVGACRCTFLRSYREPTLSGAPLSPCFAAEGTREGTLMSLPEGAPARSGWGVKFGHPDVTTDDTAPLASPPGA